MFGICVWQSMLTFKFSASSTSTTVVERCMSSPSSTPRATVDTTSDDFGASGQGRMENYNPADVGRRRHVGALQPSSAPPSQLLRQPAGQQEVSFQMHIHLGFDVPRSFSCSSSGRPKRTSGVPESSGQGCLHAARMFILCLARLVMSCAFQRPADRRHKVSEF